MTHHPTGAAAIGGDAVDRRALLFGAAGLGLGALTSACSSSAKTGRRTPAGRPAPASVSGAGSLRAIFRRTAVKTTTPGAVMLYRAAEGTVTATYGSRTTDGAAPVTLADHFRIGSVTKTFTATVILQLAQEGKLRLDDSVATYHSGVPNGHAITMAQLLNMRSGLYNYSEAREFNRTLDRHPEKVWAPDELLALSFAHEPYFPPGKGFHYTNTGLVLLGLIAEKLDGGPLAASYQRRLFEPLGLHGTSLPADPDTIPAPHPHGYMYGTNVSTMESGELPTADQAAAAAGTLKPSDVTAASPSWTWAAGGGVSTARDLLTWVTALGDGSLLDPAWQRRRLASLRPVDPAAPDSPSYGLGIAKFGPMYGHTGELPGFQAFTGYDPATERALVVLANLNAAPDGSPVAATIAQDLIRRIYR